MFRKYLNEVKIDPIRERLCKILSKCNINENHQYDVCKSAMDDEVKTSTSRSNFDELTSRSTLLMGDHKDVVGVKHIKQRKNILNLDDKEFMETYVQGLSDAYINYSSYYNDISFQDSNGNEMYNEQVDRMNKTMRDLKRVVKNKGDFKNCKTFEIILKHKTFMSNVINGKYLQKIEE